MRVEDIEVHVGTPDFTYTPIRRLEAKCEAATALSAAPTAEAVNSKLREMAASIGATAVVDVEYSSGISFTSWKSMKGTGLAVKRENDEVDCPFCAEKVKRAAIKCKHCGGELSTSEEVSSSPSTARPTIASQVAEARQRHADLGAPMKATNNPQHWMIAFAVLSALGMVIALATSMH